MIAPLVAAAAITVDRTVRCQVPEQAGIPVFTLRAAPTSKHLGAGAWVLVNDRNGSGGVFLLGVSGAAGGYAPPAPGWCTPAPRIPLTHAGVPFDGVYRSPSAGLGDAFGVRCPSASRITIRLRALLVDGAAVSAQVAVRSGKALRPVAFVDWARARVTSYLASDCQG